MCVFVYVCRCTWLYISSLLSHLKLPFFSLLCISDCQSLPPFVEKEMEGKNVPRGKYRSSLFILVMGFQLLKCWRGD